MRYGIFGGAFDPIHFGHLLLAESCLRAAKLDRVIFVPTGISPHKKSKTAYSTSPEDRYNMVKLAIAGHKKFMVSRFEINRGVVSYTVETLRYFRGELGKISGGGCELFLILGGDMFCDLPNWRNAKEILQLAVPLVAFRSGSPLPQTKITYIPANMPIIEISSTNIRNLIANNNTPDFQTPKKIINYIKKHKLYQK
ncbi:MAG: nicotinate-nucleotide adenylyltransferase [Planctomycetaceae bacterium]|jgi:nicotinate-nucleotide adenylyltransferase|nr:nicotinate-nucleotide adenylyltransferase [Planctomycetaceae bacterium]